jgi:hypothetical protein
VSHGHRTCQPLNPLKFAELLVIGEILCKRGQRRRRTLRNLARISKFTVVDCDVQRGGADYQTSSGTEQRPLQVSVRYDEPHRDAVRQQETSNLGPWAWAHVHVHHGARVGAGHRVTGLVS